MWYEIVLVAGDEADESEQKGCSDVYLWEEGPRG